MDPSPNRPPVTPASSGTALLQTAGIGLVSYTVGRDHVKDPLREMVMSRAPLAVDIETEGLGAAALNLKTVTFGTRDAAVILDPRDPFQEDLIARTIAFARDLLFWNSAFDVPNLARNHLLTVEDCVKVIDGVLYARLAEPSEIVSKSLGRTWERYVPSDAKVIDSVRETFQIMRATKTEGFKRIDLHMPAFVQAAALDVIRTARLVPLARKAAYRRLTEGHPYTEDGVSGEEAAELVRREQRINRTMLRRSVRGLRIDLDFLDRYRDVNDAAIGEDTRALEKAGVVPTNPNSLAAKLEELHALPADHPRTKTGKVSTQAAHLQRLDHPLAQTFVRRKKLVKIEEDYLAKVHELASSAGRIHPVVNLLGATTGRASMGSPPLQQFPEPARGIVMCDEGDNLTSIDWCLDEDTDIETLTGPVKIKNLQLGDRVYSWRDGRVTWAQVTASRCTGYRRCAEVVLDNGRTFVASWDHRMLRRSGQEVRVHELRPGDGLAALRWGSSGKTGVDEYTTVYSRSNREYAKVHQLVAEAYHGPCPQGWHVHHLDHDRFNNSPDNLAYLSSREHHAQHDNLARVDEEKRLTALRGGLARRRSYRGDGNQNFGKLRGEHRTCTTCDRRFYVPRASLNRGAGKFCSRTCYTVAHRRQINHRVVEIRDAGVRRTYDITVSGLHNFALTCGVFSHNSQIEPVIVANLAGSTAVLERYENPNIKADVYTPVAESAGIDRKRAKTILLGLLYGLGMTKLADGLSCTEEEAMQLRSSVFKAMPGVKGYLAQLRYLAKRHMKIMTLSGRIIPIPLGSWNGQESIQTHKGINFTVQGSAYDLLAECTVDIEAAGLGDAIYLTMHDELVVSSSAAHDIRKIMETPPDRLCLLAKRTPVLRTDSLDLGQRWTVA